MVYVYCIVRTSENCLGKSIRHTYTHMYAHVYTHIHLCIYMCTHTYTYTHTYTHTQTDRHTHRQTHRNTHVCMHAHAQTDRQTHSPSTSLEYLMLKISTAFWITRIISSTYFKYGEATKQYKIHKRYVTQKLTTNLNLFKNLPHT